MGFEPTTPCLGSTRTKTERFALPQTSPRSPGRGNLQYYRAEVKLCDFISRVAQDAKLCGFHSAKESRNKPAKNCKLFRKQPWRRKDLQRILYCILNCCTMHCGHHNQKLNGRGFVFKKTKKHDIDTLIHYLINRLSGCLHTLGSLDFK